MELKKIKLSEIKPYAKNARKNDEAVEYVIKSIEQCEYIAPIILDENNVILAGHTRWKALKKLGYTEAECVIKEGLTEEQKKKYRLLDNKTAEFAEWDFDLLEDELADLDFGDLDIDWGRDELELGIGVGESNRTKKGNLNDKFIIPPFSILDTRRGYWQDRKDAWKALGIKSEIGRDAGCLPTSMGKKYGRNSEIFKNATSIFDPVLCEIMYRWYCPEGGQIYDCFAGGSVRGVVAEKLGYTYTGIDIRQEQVDANYENASEIGVTPVWYCDDSLNVDKYVKDNSVDLVFSCPPYGDLEVYSDNPNDISNMEWEDFCVAYRKIIGKSCNKLKQDRFAIFVVGDMRDKNGAYRNFVDYTKQCFHESGLVTYNEAVLINALGTAMIRASQTFKSRKLVKVHQNVLIFYKGDTTKIKDRFGEIDFSEALKQYETENGGETE